MTISAGSKLGPYEIVAPLGAGGMGEVWKALDPRIGREVAIKILHPSMSDNDELVRRFEQEARTVGQLNHPNLIAVYDVGEDGEIAYLVTELLEGDTLRERLSGGALPMRRAIEWGAGIASGLAAAHEKGIVHRDLKPENIFVTKDNRVKILDFGLARLTNVGMSDSGGTDVPTDHRTDPGKVMGTVGYMSPEQVRAMPVDHRSDIFSFGAILYEMLTGIRAFRRDSSIETMNAILKEEPPELTATNPNLHPGLERIVRHCLEKHPEARFQSAKDMAFDLESLSATSGSVPSIAAIARKKSLVPLGLVLATVVIAAIAFWAGSRFSSAEHTVSGGEAPRFTDFRRLTFRRGNIIHARLTKDAKMAVFSAAWDGRPMEVFTAQLGDRVARPLGIESADVMSVSSKGEVALLLKDNFVLTTTGGGTLARVPLGGGVPRELLENVWSADWAPDGEALAVTRYDAEKDVDVLEYPMGTELARTRGGLGGVSVSPQGDKVVFLEYATPVRAEMKVATMDGTTTTIASLDTFGVPRWLDDDTVTIGDFATRQQITIDLDGTRGVLSEAPGIEILDYLPGGIALMEREIYRMSINYGSRDLDGERDLGWLDQSLFPVLSSDGELLFSEGGEGGGTLGSIYLRSVDGSTALRLGDGFAFDLSRDGEWVVAARPDTPASLHLVPTGAGLEREISVPGVVALRDARFIGDGERMLVAGSDESGEPIFAIVDRSSSRVETIESPPAPTNIVLSPDGDRIALGFPDQVVQLRPLEGGDLKALEGSQPGDIALAWSRDGRTMWVTTDQTLPRLIYEIDVESGRRTLWKTLQPADLAGVIRVDSVSIAPDGRSWAYNYARVTDSDLYTAKLVGWK